MGPLIQLLLCAVTGVVAAYPNDESVNAPLAVGNDIAAWVTFVSEDGSALAVLPRTREPATVRIGEEAVPAAWVGHDPFLGVGLLKIEARTEQFVRTGPSPNHGDPLTIGPPSDSVTVPCRGGARWLSLQATPLGLTLGEGSSTTVLQVKSGSVAQNAGLQSGDRILAVDGRPLADRTALDRTLSFLFAGREITFRVERESEELEIAVTPRYSRADGPGRGAFLAIECETDALPEGPSGRALLPGAPVRDSDGELVGVYWKPYGPGRALALAAADFQGLLARIPNRNGPPSPMPELGEVVSREEGAFEGYTLFSPLDSYHLYLIGMDGQKVRQWTFDRPVWAAYLLDNGDVLAACVQGDTKTFAGGGGQCGRIQRRSFDGELLWDYVLSNDTNLQHHDIEPLPNGNILAICWETRTREEAIRAGRNPEVVPENGMWPMTILELAPRGQDDAEIVWQWRVWDHLIQDVDGELPNYGDPTAHPGRIDINGSERRILDDEELERLRQLGYLGGRRTTRRGGARGFGGGDWTHMNAIDFNPQLDQIVLSARHWSEVWILDHGTTTEEAAGNAGDLLYRWGNPEKYSRGTAQDRQLFGQHDAHWIPEGLPGAGHLLIFNNGEGPRSWSSIDELVLPLKPDGTYSIGASAPFGPAQPVWSYSDRGHFYSGFVSGAQRLPNGNTLICSGAEFRIFEVTPEGNVVWDYRYPRRGAGGFGAPIGGPPSDEGRVDVPGPPGIFRAHRFSKEHPGLKGRLE